MEEILRGGGRYYASKRDIEKMKKNMKKVPIIQKKSEVYHKNQGKEADLFIDHSLENNIVDITKVSVAKNIDEYGDKMGFRNRLIYIIKNLFFKSSDGN